MRAYAFDHDGTLFHMPPGTPSEARYYRDPALLHRMAPNPVVLEGAQRLVSHGHRVHIVTGREELLRQDMVAHLARHGLAAAHLHLVPEFTDLAALQQFKADCLEAIRPEWMLGDHVVDQRAAELAGVPFHHVSNLPADLLVLAH